MKIPSLSFKSWVRGTILLLLAVIFIAAPIDKLTNDDVTVTGTLYSKTYNTGKHSVSYNAHYLIEYKTTKHTRSISFEESVWKSLTNNEQRQFVLSEAEFQHPLRNYGGVLICIFLFACTIVFGGGLLLMWLLKDDNGKWLFSEK